MRGGNGGQNWKRDHHNRCVVQESADDADGDKQRTGCEPATLS